MFYIKNVPVWERLLRLVAGVGIILCGLIGLAGQPLGWVLAGGGLVTGLTGVFGFCPMCSIAGRRIVKNSRLSAD